MKEVYEKIWELALPYQDKRDDQGHAQIVRDYALELVKVYNADDMLVVPAAILHDIGWSQMTREECFVIFDNSATKEEVLTVRVKHQEKGVELAREILNKIDYPNDLIKPILEIILQHDTRQGFISREEGLVRDADKLWRYTKKGFEADIRRGLAPSKDRLEQLEQRIYSPTFFYSQAAKDIARKELRNRKIEFK